MHCTIIITFTTLPFLYKLKYKMSFFPSPVMVRLQELKLWQGNYDSLLQNKSKDGTNPSDFETIEGLSALDSTQDSDNSSPLSSPGRNKEVDWDHKTISPSKPFEQLLEEKLAQDQPQNLQAKPKRPFLRKGAGLVRYKLNEQSEPARNRKKPFKKISSDEKVKEKQPISKKCVSAPINRKSCLKPINHRKEPEIDLTPLKMPDLMIRPKATWHKVKEKTNEEVVEESKKSLDESKTPKNHFNSHIIGKINEFALRHFLPNNPHRNRNLGLLNKSNIPAETSEIQEKGDIRGNETLYEKASENELRIFEALEERAENSSFSSTNSSVIRLLSSTPNKLKMPLPKSPIPEEKKTLFEEDKEAFRNCEKQSLELQRKLQEVNVKSDVLHEFLNNLKKLGAKKENERPSNEFRESVNAKYIKRTPDTSFSDEEKWSSNTEADTRSQSPSSLCTEFDTTYKGDTSNKVDVAVNTNLSDDEIKKCVKCMELQMKLDRLSKEIPDIQAEKAKVCDFAEDLEKKRDHLNKEMQTMRKQYEDELHELRRELETEKKKSAKDKMVYDTYLKDSQNRSNRKDREEISDLKKELTEVKELMKMKETKNASTQARLRNQIKQLEKENSEFKLDIEKLQKENAKLNASQKVHRPSEAKMLHEISRTLTKLTEGTLKNHLSRSDKSSVTCNTEEVTKRGKTSKEVEYDSKEKELSSHRLKKKQTSCLKTKYPEDICMHTNSIETSSIGHNITPFSNLSLEKQYENMFGQSHSPRPNNSILNESKRERMERVFEDGSKEIKYSNGNNKTISPDGNLIIVRYYNGDIKETNLLTRTLKYYYSENQTWHTQFYDGTELLEYPSGQKEKKYKDGKKEITCVDGSHVTKMADGTEEIVYPDKSRIIKNLSGDRILYLPNGQKEIHTKEHKRREYPDGTVKILFPDGTQETRYASGRVRVKDVNGILIMDSHNSVPK